MQLCHLQGLWTLKRKSAEESHRMDWPRGVYNRESHAFYHYYCVLHFISIKVIISCRWTYINTAPYTPLATPTHSEMVTCKVYTEDATRCGCKTA